METNSLYFGDNLKVLQERLPDGTYRFPSQSVDLVYLDPPFNSNRDYSLIFKEKGGAGADAQIRAFEDTWHWGPNVRDAFRELTVDAVNDGRIPDQVGRMLESLVRGLGHNDMSAYLVMMTPRLVELHRVLKATGSLYLHCDPTASHYLKVLLDAIFGPENFVNEIAWKRWSSHPDAKRYGSVHDVILFYGRTDAVKFNRQFTPYDDEYVRARFKFVDADGRRYAEQTLVSPNPRPNLTYEYTASNGVTYKPHRNGWSISRELMEQFDREGRLHFPVKGERLRRKDYLDRLPGVALADVWTDIYGVGGSAKERLGYPTQKPLALLERIVSASSEPGDVVLDPFCGCGTAVIAAEKLKRKWIGIDITHLSIAVMRARLMDSFGLKDVPVFGLPEDLESARMLAEQSKDGRYEFQWWALGRIDAKPIGGKQQKGADRGIDGVITFSERDAIQRILVSVKSGKPKLDHVKELIGTLQTEGGAIGVLIELDDPTSEMRRAAVESGRYESELWGGSYDRVQILTVAQLLAGKKPNVPKFLPGYQRAQRIKAKEGDQQELFAPGEAVLRG